MARAVAPIHVRTAIRRMQWVENVDGMPRLLVVEQFRN